MPGKGNDQGCAKHLFNDLLEAEPEEFSTTDSCSSSPTVTSGLEREYPNKTLLLLQQRGVKIKSTNQLIAEEEGLLTLAGIMGMKYDTIRPLLHHIKRAQSSGRRIFLNLKDEPQENIADITLVANLSHKAGLLPSYKYVKSPQYKLYCEPPISPIAINFFTGHWLELYALRVVRDIEAKSATDLSAVSGVHIELPNGDQFDLDLIFSVADRLIWVEAKTADDFSGLLPKYKRISELLCATDEDAIILWSTFHEMDRLKSTRGTLARMTVCSPKEFPTHIQNRLKQYGVGPDENELARPNPE